MSGVCWVCDSEEVHWVDVLGFNWCKPCLDDHDEAAAKLFYDR